MCSFCVSKAEIDLEGENYIKAYILIRKDVKELVVKIFDTDFEVYSRFTDIKYCPMCGDEL
jgi:hypothetical protein